MRCRHVFRIVDGCGPQARPRGDPGVSPRSEACFVLVNNCMTMVAGVVHAHSRTACPSMTIVSSPCMGITRRPVRACTARAGLPFRSRSRHSNASHRGSGRTLTQHRSSVNGRRKLTVTPGGTKTQVPLRGQFSRAAVSQAARIDLDGRRNGNRMSR